MYFEIDLRRILGSTGMLQVRATLSKSDIGWAYSKQRIGNGYSRKNEVASGLSDRAFAAIGLHPGLF
ncbi:MAG: hypothetical protein NTU79_23585 [Planctomycetota bacterium]|nr:hypothetical protein [Planctomycetota bacterium]